MPIGAFKLNSIAKYTVYSSSPRNVITAVGNAQISTSQSKFNSASAYFDGSGDYLYTNPNSEFNSGSSDWTWEFWAWTSTIAAGSRIPMAGKIDFEPLVYMTASTMRLYLSKTGTAWDLVNGVTVATMTANTWTHIAVVRNGTTIKTYKDGVQTSSTTVGASDVVWWSTNQIYIGDLDPSYSTAYWNGYLDEIRVSKTARYTTNFTPSTTPFVNDSNTLLLLHMDGIKTSTKFFDDSGSRPAVAYRSGTVLPSLPTSAGKFNGYINVPADAYIESYIYPIDSTWYFNSNKIWTVEFWIKVSDTNWNASASSTLVKMYADTNTGLSIAATGSTNTVGLYVGGTLRTSTTLSTSFDHFALVNNGAGSLNFYKNGILLTTVTWSNNYNSRYLNFGQNFNVGNINFGYDDIRVSKVQRYTANFTPPSQEFTNDTNTLLLFNCNDGILVDNNT